MDRGCLLCALFQFEFRSSRSQPPLLPNPRHETWSQDTGCVLWVSIVVSHLPCGLCPILVPLVLFTPPSLASFHVYHDFLLFVPTQLLTLGVWVLRICLGGLDFLMDSMEVEPKCLRFQRMRRSMVLYFDRNCSVHTLDALACWDWAAKFASASKCKSILQYLHVRQWNVLPNSKPEQRCLYPIDPIYNRATVYLDQDNANNVPIWWTQRNMEQESVSGSRRRWEKRSSFAKGGDRGTMDGQGEEMFSWDTRGRTKAGRFGWYSSMASIYRPSWGSLSTRSHNGDRTAILPPKYTTRIRRIRMLSQWNTTTDIP